MEHHFQAPAFPDWVGTAIRGTPWVVVRRAFGTDDEIPVGIRGRERGLRFATWISPDHIAEVRPPATLVDPAGWRAAYGNRPPPQVHGLLAVSPILHASGYEWGPAGGLAYELATGTPSINPESDLDLVVEIPEPIDVALARSLLAEMQTLSPVRLDVQMITPAGGLSWADYCASDRVLVKTVFAPVLRKKNKLWH